MTAGPALVEVLRSAQAAMVEELGALVTCESPSSDLAATARCADLVAELGRSHLGSAPDRLVVEGRTHLRWRLGPTPPAGRVLLVGHLDTVWPLGSLSTHPFTVEDGRATGPGCFDMKAGIVQLFHALGALADLADLETTGGVTVLLTSDEELGSPTSRSLVEESAREAAAALVCEPASGAGPGGPAGALKSARKGVS
ncbi:MAG: M20/M25/M40 family metallo-hydrolase, partial [Acidimicrobiales bacterium]